MDNIFRHVPGLVLCDTDAEGAVPAWDRPEPARISAHRREARAAALASSAPGIRTMNSSPPYRPVMSQLLQLPRKMAATCRNTASPDKWPCVSLTCLNLSTSIMRHENVDCLPSASLTSDSALRCRYARLYSSVRKSLLVRSSRRRFSCRELKYLLLRLSSIFFCAVMLTMMPSRPWLPSFCFRHPVQYSRCCCTPFRSRFSNLLTDLPVLMTCASLARNNAFSSSDR